MRTRNPQYVFGVNFHAQKLFSNALCAYDECAQIVCTCRRVTSDDYLFSCTVVIVVEYFSRENGVSALAGGRRKAMEKNRKRNACSEKQREFNNINTLCGGLLLKTDREKGKKITIIELDVCARTSDDSDATEE